MTTDPILANLLILESAARLPSLQKSAYEAELCLRAAQRDYDDAEFQLRLETDYLREESENLARLKKLPAA